MNIIKNAREGKWKNNIPTIGIFIFYTAVTLYAWLSLRIL